MMVRIRMMAVEKIKMQMINNEDDENTENTDKDEGDEDDDDNSRQDT